MPKQGQIVKKKKNDVLSRLTKHLEDSLENQKLHTEILEKHIAKKKKRKKKALDKAKGNSVIKVLIADTGDEIFFMAKNELGKINGTSFDVSRAVSYDQVFSAIDDSRFDIILLDCESFTDDEQDAADLVKAAKKKNKHVPIIVYGPEDAHECDMLAMEAGAADFLEKTELTAKRLEKSIRYCLCSRG